MKRFNTSKLVTIIIACCIIIVIATTLFIGPFILEFHTLAKEQCRYGEDMNMLTYQLEDYLQDYYKEHDRYPNKLDISLFEVWEIPKYRPILDKITYSTDEKSFEIVWKRPIYIRSGDEWFLITIGGQDGKRAHYESETIRAGNASDRDIVEEIVKLFL